MSVPGWSGYIIFDPVTGDGAFKIGNGLSGGYLDLIGIGMFFLSPLFASVSLIAPGVGFAFNALLATGAVLLIMAAAMANSGKHEEAEYVCYLAIILIITALMFLFKNPYPANSVAGQIVNALTGGFILGVPASKGCSVQVSPENNED